MIQPTNFIDLTHIKIKEHEKDTPNTFIVLGCLYFKRGVRQESNCSNKITSSQPPLIYCVIFKSITHGYYFNTPVSSK